MEKREPLFWILADVLLITGIDIGHDFGGIFFHISCRGMNVGLFKDKSVASIAFSYAETHHYGSAITEMEFGWPIGSGTLFAKEGNKDGLEIVGLVGKNGYHTVFSEMTNNPLHIAHFVVKTTNFSPFFSNEFEPCIGKGIELTVDDNSEIAFLLFHGDTPKVFPVAEMAGDNNNPFALGKTLFNDVIVFKVAITRGIFFCDLPEFEVFKPSTGEVLVDLFDECVGFFFGEGVFSKDNVQIFVCPFFVFFVEVKKEEGESIGESIAHPEGKKGNEKTEGNNDDGFKNVADVFTCSNASFAHGYLLFVRGGGLGEFFQHHFRENKNACGSSLGVIGIFKVLSSQAVLFL